MARQRLHTLDTSVFTDQSGIYYIDNTANGRLYIGIAKNLLTRCSGHQTKLLRNRHDNRALQADWNSCGMSAFHFGVLLSGDSTQNLRSIEAMFIRLFQTNNPHYGYNSQAQVQQEVRPNRVITTSILLPDEQRFFLDYIARQQGVSRAKVLAQVLDIARKELLARCGKTENDLNEAYKAHTQTV